MFQLLAESVLNSLGEVTPRFLAIRVVEDYGYRCQTLSSSAGHVIVISDGMIARLIRLARYCCAWRLPQAVAFDEDADDSATLGEPSASRE